MYVQMKTNFRKFGSWRLLDALLALLGVEIPRRAEAALVLGNQRPHDGILPRFGVVIVVAFRGKGSRVKLGPVHLSKVRLMVGALRGGNIHRACRGRR